MYHSCGQAGANNPVHVIDTGVSPHPAIQLKAGKDDKGKDCIERRKLRPVSDQVVYSCSELSVDIEADEKSKEVRRVKSYDIERIYIILLTKELSADNRLGYQKAGINDTLDSNASITELNKKIQFISDRENMLFDDQQPKYRMLRFKIPIWKRIVDVFFAIVARIITSPIFILTAIAIRLESKGPVIFKSKRVGANYTIFRKLKMV